MGTKVDAHFSPAVLVERIDQFDSGLSVLEIFFRDAFQAKDHESCASAEWIVLGSLVFRFSCVYLQGHQTVQSLAAAICSAYQSVLSRLSRMRPEMSVKSVGFFVPSSASSS